MAKKKTERKASNSKEATIWQSILKSEKTDFLVGMMIAILAIHLTVSMVSYINTGSRRPESARELTSRRVAQP